MTIEQAPTGAPEPQGEVRIPVTIKSAAKKANVTYVLLVITIALYGLQYLSQSITPQDYDWLYLLGGKINQFILQGEVWRLITPVFLHGGLLHIGFNMYALYSIGPGLERHYGHGRFLLLYLVGGFAGNTLSFLLSSNPSLGASTAIFGLVAAEAIFIYRNKKMYGARAKSMLMNLGMVILVNLALGFSAGSGIDNWGHLGGMAGGFLFAWTAGPIYKLQMKETGYELVDQRTKEQVLLGLLLSVGIFIVLDVIKFVIG